jgi:hypothetical protein
MNKYQIQVTYQTGNSFSSEEVTELWGPTYSNEDVAKRNLQRIKEHYELYMLHNKDWNADKTQLKVALKKASHKDWFAGEGKSHQYWEYSLKLELEDGTFRKQSVHWCGYFESLWNAEIVTEKSDSKISFR